jgi:hypothetical protein
MADDLVETDLPCVGDTVVQVVERLAVEEVRRVDRVTGLAQFVGECEEPGRLSLCVMEQERCRHHDTLVNAVRRGAR